MRDTDWMKEFPGAIIVCDQDGIVLDMNEKAASNLEQDGGRSLVGKNLLDCHPEPAKSKVGEMLQSHTRNVYTIEKNGVKKLIYQTPWYRQGRYAGFVELSLEIPFELPHFIRS